MIKTTIIFLELVISFSELVMKSFIIILLVLGSFYYWDRGLGDYIEGNYMHIESNSLQWLKDHTPSK